MNEERSIYTEPVEYPQERMYNRKEVIALIQEVYDMGILDGRGYETTLDEEELVEWFNKEYPED